MAAMIEKHSYFRLGSTLHTIAGHLQFSLRQNLILAQKNENNEKNPVKGKKKNEILRHEAQVYAGGGQET